MADRPEELSPDEKHRMNFMGLVLFLRQMATQLVQQRQLDEARGLIDSVESLQVKTQGNVSDEERKLLEGVLYELRMAVVSVPSGPEPPSESAEPPSEPEAQEGD